ncbi:MAG: hypothetical protein ACRD07_11950 [Acidimicrobiales bacterium]
MHETVFSRRTARRHRAIVLVSAAGRRILPALRFVSRLPQTEVRALHVSVDSEETRRLAQDWMKLDLAWLPLHVHDPAADDLPTSVRRAIESEADELGDVVIVVPELDFTHWWHPLLHRRSARRIAQQLQPLKGVTTVIVPFTAPLDGGTRAP